MQLSDAKMNEFRELRFEGDHRFMTQAETKWQTEDGKSVDVVVELYGTELYNDYKTELDMYKSLCTTLGEKYVAKIFGYGQTAHAIYIVREKLVRPVLASKRSRYAVLLQFAQQFALLEEKSIPYVVTNLLPQCVGCRGDPAEPSAFVLPMVHLDAFKQKYFQIGDFTDDGKVGRFLPTENTYQLQLFGQRIFGNVPMAIKPVFRLGRTMGSTQTPRSFYNDLSSYMRRVNLSLPDTIVIDTPELNLPNGNNAVVLDVDWSSDRPRGISFEITPDRPVALRAFILRSLANACTVTMVRGGYAGHIGNMNSTKLANTTTYNDDEGHRIFVVLKTPLMLDAGATVTLTIYCEREDISVGDPIATYQDLQIGPFRMTGAVRMMGGSGVVSWEPRYVPMTIEFT